MGSINALKGKVSGGSEKGSPYMSPRLSPKVVAPSSPSPACFSVPRRKVRVDSANSQAHVPPVTSVRNFQRNVGGLRGAQKTLDDGMVWNGFDRIQRGQKASPRGGDNAQKSGFLSKKALPKHMLTARKQNAGGMGDSLRQMTCRSRLTLMRRFTHFTRCGYDVNHALCMLRASFDSD